MIYLQIVFFDQIGSQVCDSHTQNSPSYFPVFEQVFDYFIDQIGRNRKTISGIITCGTGDSRVDTDQISVEVDQGPSTISFVDSGIGLDKAFNGIRILSSVKYIDVTPYSTDDPCGNRTAK